MSTLERVAERGWICPSPAEDGVVYLAEPVAVSYPEEGLEVLGLEGGAGFWFEHRAQAVVDALRVVGASSVWDVGAGTGSMSLRLRAAGFDVVAIEPYPKGARTIAKKGIATFCGTMSDLGLPDNALQTVGMFDVIEHLPDPSAVLHEVHRVLEPGGHLVLTVPAHQWLWGDEDDVNGHFRRYTRMSLAAELAAAHLQPVRIDHLFASLVPAALVSRALPYRMGRRRPAHAVHQRMQRQLSLRPTADRMAAAVMRGEAAVGRNLPLPFGLSLMGLFRKA